MNVLRSLINVNGILCNEHHIANGTPLICDVIIAMKLCVGQVGRKCRKVVIFGLTKSSSIIALIVGQRPTPLNCLTCYMDPKQQCKFGTLSIDKLTFEFCLWSEPNY